VRLATYHRADRPLQYGDLLGTVQATNLEGHVWHRMFSLAVLIVPRPSLSSMACPSARLLGALETGTHRRVGLSRRTLSILTDLHDTPHLKWLTTGQDALSRAVPA
jgi:hypothetical protein